MGQKKRTVSPEDMLTLADAARYLHVSRSAITQAVSRGRLKKVLVTVKEWRISRATLDAYLQTKKKDGRPPTHKKIA